jgi:PDZ domain/Peptide-N-glycosidase F, C terminal
VKIRPFQTDFPHLSLGWLLGLLLLALPPAAARARQAPAAHLATFAAGGGPREEGGVYHLLDAARTPGQLNAVAFPATQRGAFARLTLRCRLRVLKGGEGGAFLFLNTADYGRRGPAPFVRHWTVPNLAGSFAVGIDVYDPPVEKPSGRLANYQGRPQREVSLHWDGREIVRRVAPVEFRGEFADCEILVEQVAGGAEITVRLAGAAVYDHFFLPGMHPYEARLAIGAGTTEQATTKFDVKDLAFTQTSPAKRQRPPLHFELFNHVRIANPNPAARRQVTLPPADWAFARLILTLELHDAGPQWDGWDRTGSLAVIDADGVRHVILPFITSFRTPGRWQVDVTPFRPWLSGPVTFEIAIGTDTPKKRGFMLSASLDFYHGTPKLEPFRIVPLWTGTAHYRSAANHFSDFFPPRSVAIDAATRAAKLFITTSGHNKVGEFTPSRRSVIFAPEKGGDPAAERRFSNLLWRSDCYLNPVRPQAGTWYYARAGWAPGDVVRPWRIDLTPAIVPGRTAELRYQPEPYDFSNLPADRRPTEAQIDQATQIVNAYLILYRTPADLQPAPFLRVLDVDAGSNAARAGIREGDYLLSYAGERPTTIEALRAAIRKAAAAGKKRVTVGISRGDRQLELELEPGRMGVLLEEE